MVLEAGALELLPRVPPPILQRLQELLGQRVTELRQAAIRLPVVQEAPAEVVPGRGEEAGISPRGGRRIGGMDAPPELAELDLIGHGAVGVILQPGPLEI